MAKPQVSLGLTWTGDLSFRADTRDGRSVLTDGNGHVGLSPVELLAVSTAGCMAVDVVHILTRSRFHVVGLHVVFTGDHSQTESHRLTRIRLGFELDGNIPQSQLDRALQLSREKYCSVWNTLRDDVELEVTTRIGAPTA